MSIYLGVVDIMPHPQGVNWCSYLTIISTPLFSGQIRALFGTVNNYHAPGLSPKSMDAISYLKRPYLFTANME
jgi:hypothetical protein